MVAYTKPKQRKKERRRGERGQIKFTVNVGTTLCNLLGSLLQSFPFMEFEFIHGNYFDCYLHLFL